MYQKIFLSLTILLTLCILIYPQIKKPNNQNYYYGIGSNKISEENFRKLAKNKALRDLATEIRINISSEFKQEITEKSGLVESEVSNTIQTNIQSDLEGFELVKELRESGYYYVLYRLSKLKHKKIQIKKRETSVKKSLAYHSQAKKYFDENRYSEGIRSLLLSLQEIDKYLAINLKAEIKGEETIINTYLINLIQENLNKIEIKPVSNPINYDLVTHKGNKIGLKSNVKNGSEIIPVSNFPIHLSFIEGEGNLEEKVVTKSEGQATAGILKLNPSKQKALIKAEFDINSFIEADSESLFSKILANFTLPSTKVNIELNPISIFISANEKNLNKTMQQNLIEPSIKNNLTKNGFNFVDDRETAEYEISITSNTRKGNEIYGQYVTYLNLSIKVINLKNNTEIFAINKPNIKGIRLNYNEAGLNAYKKFKSNLSTMLVPKIIEGITNN